MAEKEQKAEEKKENKDRFQLVEVPTQTTIVVRDTEAASEKEELWDDKKVLVEILNRLESIEKNTG